MQSSMQARRRARGRGLRVGTIGLVLTLLSFEPGIATGGTGPAAGFEADVADYLGRPIASVRLQTADTRELRDEAFNDLIETRVGTPLAMQDVRETILHLFSLGTFQDVQLDVTATEAGVALVYNLVPLRSVTRLVFRGDLGLSEQVVRQAVVDRHGQNPPLSRAEEAIQTIEQVYRNHGYVAPQVTFRPDPRPESRELFLTFDINSGSRALVNEIRIRGTPLLTRAQLLDRLDLASARPYDGPALQRRLTSYADTLRSRGYYEATADHSVEFLDGGTKVDVTLEIQPGPLVRVVFEGDPLPADRLEDLVPVRREGSVDEDLLEDSARGIRNFLHAAGYWRAEADYRRTPAGAELEIAFLVRAGPQYRVDRVEVSGNASVPLGELEPLLSVAPGDLFVESRLDADVAAITELYRRRGYVEVKVASAVVESDSPPADPAAANSRRVLARLVIVEGVRTSIGSVAFSGMAGPSEAELRPQVTAAPGTPFYRTQIAADRDRILLHYLNLGYPAAKVEALAQFSEDRTRADIQFSIVEGPQVLVDHILVVGNTRISTATIRRELAFRPGDPLGLESIQESQRRLRALGLFRSVRITELTHDQAGRRDLVVAVEEAPATSLGYGAGLEAGKRLRRSAESGGAAVERLEFAPRGFFEIGRRNLWGKNRSIDLFTRVSVRRDDEPVEVDQEQGGFGFSEYRVLGSYREPRAFGWNADAVVTGYLEQAIRSSFNFARRGVTAELARRLSTRLLLNNRFSIERTRLFNERFNPDDKLLIDRLFPQVRIASLSSALLRDSRSDPLEPAAGALLGVETEVAGPNIGSQVGFSKAFFQGFVYRRLPGRRRTILALGARLGIADGFARTVERVDANGHPVLDESGNPVVDEIDEIPASERFFAGGDTTVRGFALDRLGTEETIDQDGFPKGGNAMLIFNSEIRFPVWRDLDGVAFLDAGNVFARVDDLDLGEIRGGAGFGVRYRSPIGPIRVDLGFKLDRRQFGGEKESLTALHISIGHAF